MAGADDIGVPWHHEESGRTCRAMVWPGPGWHRAAETIMAEGDVDDDDEGKSESDHAKARERMFMWIMCGLAVVGLIGGICIGVWIK